MPFHQKGRFSDFLRQVTELATSSLDVTTPNLPNRTGDSSHRAKFDFFQLHGSKIRTEIANIWQAVMLADKPSKVAGKRGAVIFKSIQTNSLLLDLGFIQRLIPWAVIFFGENWDLNFFRRLSFASHSINDFPASSFVYRYP